MIAWRRVAFALLNGVEVRLGLARIGDLLPHEEFLPSRAEEVARSVLRLGAVLRPILVEARTGVVLDGAHRLAALRMLRARYAPVAAVDYSSVALRGWARMYEPSASDDIRRLLPVKRSVDLGGLKVFELEGLDSYYDIKELEAMGHRLLGVVVPSALRRLGAGVVAVVPPEPTKDLVLSAATSGRLLPPRSTRHVTPAKEIRLKVPLRALIRGDPDA